MTNGNGAARHFGPEKAPAKPVVFDQAILPIDPHGQRERHRVADPRQTQASLQSHQEQQRPQHHRGEPKKPAAWSEHGSCGSRRRCSGGRGGTLGARPFHFRCGCGNSTAQVTSKPYRFGSEHARRVFTLTRGSLSFSTNARGKFMVLICQDSLEGQACRSRPAMILLRHIGCRVGSASQKAGEENRTESVKAASGGGKGRAGQSEAAAGCVRRRPQFPGGMR